MHAPRWLKLVIVLAGLVTLVLVGTPFVIKHYLSQWLLDNGGERVRVEDVDFNPFTATLALEGLEVQVSTETTLAFESAQLGLAWLPLFNKQVAVESVALSGFTLLVEAPANAPLRVGGITLPGGEENNDTPPAEQGPGWLAGVQTLALNDVNLLYRSDPLNLTLVLKTLTLEQLAQWSPEASAGLAAGGSLNGAPFELQARLAPFAATPNYQATLNLNGLPLADFAALAGPPVDTLTGHLSYQGTLEFTQLPDGFSVAQSGDTGLQALELSLSEPQIHVLNTSTALVGKLALQSTGDTLTFDLGYDGELNGLNVAAEGGALELVRAETLALKALQLKGADQLSLAQMDIGELTFGRSADSEESDAFIDVRQFQVEGIRLAESLLSVDKVHYRDGHSHIRRDAEGRLRIVGILESMNRLVDKEKSGENGETAQPEPPPEPLAVAVKRIEASGESGISFVDASVKPTFATALAIDTIVIENLDTRKPEQASPVSFTGGIGKHTTLSAQGQIQPFLSPVGVDIKANIHALDLPQLSPYTRQSLGLLLDSGTLDADASAVIAPGKMDGEIALKLHQLTFENVESENSLQSRIPVPLNVALDTLRDSHNTITLNIPVEGDPANPEFNINDVLSQALASGVQQGALTYLTLALQPYGTLITAAKYAGEAINKVHLKPVAFEAGQALIDDTDKDYLSKVAGMLEERPKLAIKICGVATQADVEFLQAQAVAREQAAGKGKEKSAQPAAPPAVDEAELQALAKSRAAVVKDYLVDTFKTPAARLVGCRPRVDTGKAEASPRTDLLI